MARRARTVGGRSVGAVAILAVVTLNTLLWSAFPPESPDGRGAVGRQIVGEFVGSTVVVLFALALVLATRARWLEPWFGGLDKMYRAHRQTAVVGYVLLVVHVALTPWRLSPGGGVPAGMIAFVGFSVMVALSIGPRVPGLRRVFSIGYGAWRRTHRFIGIFLVMALAHMLLVDALVHDAPAPLSLLMAAYVIGILAFLYSLLIARFVRRRRAYAVQTVRRLDATTVEIGLRPRKKTSVSYRAGQFVFVTFRRRGLREPHPFTVSSAPHDPLLRLTIKASGDFTGRLYERAEPGVKATVEGSYGLMDHRSGRPHQLWVAGGIGVTPFLSWCRTLAADDGDLARDADAGIDFVYTVRDLDDALFWAEIQQIAGRVPGLRTHLHVSSRDGRLTVARLSELSAQDLPAVDVFLCGPVPMIAALERGLRTAGVPTQAIHYEEFSFR